MGVRSVRSALRINREEKHSESSYDGIERTWNLEMDLGAISSTAGFEDFSNENTFGKERTSCIKTNILSPKPTIRRDLTECWAKL